MTSTPYSELRSKSRINLLEAIPLQYPLSLYIEPTNRCNFKCTFCPESFESFETKTGGFHFLTYSDMQKIVSDIQEITGGKGVKTINFYMMGEPLMNSDTPRFIQLCRSEGVSEKIILTSNGSLLKGERASNLAASPPDYLRISIYGGNSDQHRRVTSSRIPLEAIRDNIANFVSMEKSYPCHIYVKMIDQGPEINQEFLELFEGIANEVAVEPVMNWNDPEEGNLAGKNSDEMLQDSYFSKRKNVCPSPFYVSVIHSDLNVSVCCVDWAKETVVGNLKTQSLREIWNGEKLRNFQNLHLREQRRSIKACANCTYIHTFPDNIDPLSGKVI